MDGRRVRDLSLPADRLMVLIVRAGLGIFPAEDTRRQAGDHLTCFIKGDSPGSCALVQSGLPG